MTQNLTSKNTRASLLCRLRDYSDTSSWELFVRTYGPSIYHFCSRRGVQDSSAVDLVQEVLIQVVLSIRTFEYDPSRGRFRDWLGAVVRSKLARFWQSQAKSSVVGNTYDFDQHHGKALAAEWASELDAHLLQVALESIRHSFSTANWRAFELTWIEGKEANNVANILKIPISQVYIAKSRIMKRLVEELQHLSDDTTWLAGMI